MEDKNIDRLFQERLKDLEVMPNPELWQNIENKLSKKKKKRIVPFWWFSSGAAAVLLVTLLITNPFKEGTDPNLIVPIIEKNSNRNTVETKTIQIDTTGTNTKTNGVEELIVSDVVKKESVKKNSVVKEEIIRIVKAKQKDKKSTIKTEIASNNNNIKNDKKELKKDVLERNDKTLIAKNNTTLNSTNKTTNRKKKEDINAIAALVEEDKEKENNQEKANKKWSVTPVLGILASSAFSGGSPIDERLNLNTISTDGTLAYGVKVGYQLNKNWSIRTGVQFQKNVINTENVGLFSSATSDNNLQAVNFSIQDSFTFVSLEPSDLQNSENPVGSPSLGNPDARNTTEGSLAQTYSYIEIPLEIQYQFYETKTLKTQLVTGFSTLFLSDNSVDFSSSLLNQPIGEANNLNTLNFSGNIGVNLDIQLSKSIHFSLNPMLKAQLNTYSKNSEDFTPFIFGMYSGVTFGF